MAAPRIALRAVSMRYLAREGETEALSGLEMTVSPGEFVAIVGPSGCGKSTILSLIAGVLRPTSGTVTLDGRPVSGPSRRIGYMLQRDHLFDWRTVEENCLIGPEVQGLSLRAARERVAHLLEQTGLLAFRHAYPEQLSGGMRQRVALVRTLAIDPDTLLLDEPFSALDFQTRLGLADEVSAILRAHGKTAVLVTHDIPEAITMADRVLVLTGRPARVQSEHVMHWDSPGRLTPFQAREAPEFNLYFQRIWKELQGHEQS